MKNSIELIEESFKLLPRDAQKAIQQFEYDKTLKEIHKSNKLHIDQASSLEKIVSGIIFGEIESQNLVSHIQNELRLDGEKSLKLGLEVNTKILIPIQEKMQEIQSMD